VRVDRERHAYVADRLSAARAAVSAVRAGFARSGTGGRATVRTWVASCATESPGRRRWFTVATACWGRMWSLTPPLKTVAAVVVRTIAAVLGDVRARSAVRKPRKNTWRRKIAPAHRRAGGQNRPASETTPPGPLHPPDPTAQTAGARRGRGADTVGRWVEGGAAEGAPAKAGWNGATAESMAETGGVSRARGGCACAHGPGRACAVGG